MAKRIIFTVTNDLAQDQRMNRICSSLAKSGYETILIGRELRISKPLSKKAFIQRRLYCYFTKGKLFYLEYNIRLFFFLLFQKADILCAIDLDTILPAFLVSKIRRVPFVYDAHEYFAQLEEVVTRPLIRKTWESLENIVVPHVKYAYTVSEGYAGLFKEKYGMNFEIIRNATVLKDFEKNGSNGIAKERYILYQGSVNYGRGLENLVEAMQYINAKLFVCGKGDILHNLKNLTAEMKLNNKITFFGFVEPEPLKEYTAHATVGITLFSNIGLSNHFSLANRFFDYLHSGVPQVAMSYPEYKKFNEKHEVALLIDDLKTETIVKAVNRMLDDKEFYRKLRNNCLEARKEFNWQNEEKKLLRFYEKIAEAD